MNEKEKADFVKDCFQKIDANLKEIAVILSVNNGLKSYIDDINGDSSYVSDIMSIINLAIVTNEDAIVAALSSHEKNKSLGI